MQSQQIRIAGLLQKYESALKEYGLGYATQLQQLKRAGTVIHRHENQGAEYLDNEIVAEYYREIESRFYEGKVNRKRHTQGYREIERFIRFAETGEVKLVNPEKGCRQKITSEFEKIVEEYLSGDMHPNTRNDARWVAHKYFAWLEGQGFENLKDAGALQIQKFLLDCSNKMAMNSMHDVRLHLAKLYAYLYESGLSDSAYQALLSFKVNRESRIYPLLPKADIAKMLDAINRQTIEGKRAYAVMLLGTVLGLRACDVVALKLTDIDWVRGEIKFVQSKTGKTAVLPLTRDVGEALKDYILNARPKTDSKQIFIRLRTPYTPLAAAVTIGEIFRDCCIAAGLPVSKRFHSLRRSLATSMVTNGVSIYDVAQGLGDVDIESTKPYIALDSKHLKICALSFDGIAPIGGK